MKIPHKERCLWLACGILIGSGLVTTQADYSAKVLGNNPTAYWRLNDKVQVPAADLAINSGSLGATGDGFYVGAATSHPVPGALVAEARHRRQFRCDSRDRGERALFRRDESPSSIQR